MWFKADWEQQPETPLPYSRFLTSVQVGVPRGGKSKREMRLHTVGPRPVPSSKRTSPPTCAQLFFLKGETGDSWRL